MKYLIIRQDAIILPQPAFVLQAFDPLAEPALRVYARLLIADGASDDHVRKIEALADDMQRVRLTETPRPHRGDDPMIMTAIASPGKQAKLYCVEPAP